MVHAQRKSTDAFGRALLAWAEGDLDPEIVERDDGLIELGAGPRGYQAPFREWPLAERQSLRYVRGRVGDIGCGSGRLSLHLQTRRPVVGVDSSRLALRAARVRGVQHVLRAAVTNLAEHVAAFDTLVLFGNNLGMFGTPRVAVQVLTQWHARAQEGTRVLIESTSPHGGGAPVLDRQYVQHNRAQGRLPGQCTMRVWFDRESTDWFPWFFMTESELRALVEDTPWTVGEVWSSSPREPFVIGLEKA